jgi:hypothetical protein
MHYTAHPTSVLVHIGELVLLCGAQDRGEDGADVWLYATAYLYQTCREYVQQIRRAIMLIGGQMSYGSADKLGKPVS